MSTNSGHWTNDDTDSYVFRVAFDFITYIKNLHGAGKVSQAELARRMGVSKGRISQIFNNPGNLTLKQMVRVARAIGNKISVVAYDDGDATNQNGPINAAVFTKCWEAAGKPNDFFSAAEAEARAAFRKRVVNLKDTIPFEPDAEMLTSFAGATSVNSTSTVGSSVIRKHFLHEVCRAW